MYDTFHVRKNPQIDKSKGEKADLWFSDLRWFKWFKWFKWFNVDLRQGGKADLNQL